MNKEELLTLLKKYEEAYYSGESLISDEEYDALKEQYVNQYGEYEFVPNEGNTGFKKVKHLYPLLSLDKIQITDKIKLRKWLEKLWPVVIQPKFDGLSVEIQAEKIVTRGNGEIGDDVTIQCLRISDINFVMELVANDETGPLRAEILMTHREFNRLNEERKAQGLKPFDNCRNAAAGMLRNKDLSKVKGLTVMVYEELGSTCNESDDIYNIKELIGEENLEYMEDTIRITPMFKPVDIDAAIDFLDNLEGYRKLIDYDIDGWVVKSDIDNSLEVHGGYTGHHPKNAFAVKGEAKGAWTKLKSITWQVGKENITPVAELEPVKIEGSTISRATLHNISIMEALNLNYIGASFDTMVKIVKANDVIPRIIEVRQEEPAPECARSFMNIVPPEKCPVCGGLTAIKESDSDSKILTCTNQNCEAKLHAKIEQMASRDGFNIVGLSEGTITKILDTYDVEHPGQILSMTVDEIMELDGFAQKSAENLHKSLQKAKAEQPLNKIMYSAAIPLVGRDASKRICEAYSLKELGEIFDKDEEDAIKDLCKIKNIGKEIATSLVKNVGVFIMMLSDIEKRIDIKKEKSNKEQLAFCITGQREPFKSMIEKAGHKVTGSVSKKTKALIDSSMDMSTTKAIKAQELNIPIISTVEELEKFL